MRSKLRWDRANGAEDGHVGKGSWRVGFGKEEIEGRWGNKE